MSTIFDNFLGVGARLAGLIRLSGHFTCTYPNFRKGISSRNSTEKPVLKLSQGILSALGILAGIMRHLASSGATSFACSFWTPGRRQVENPGE